MWIIMSTPHGDYNLHLRVVFNLCRDSVYGSTHNCGTKLFDLSSQPILGVHVHAVF